MVVNLLYFVLYRTRKDSSQELKTSNHRKMGCMCCFPSCPLTFGLWQVRQPSNRKRKDGMHVFCLCANSKAWIDFHHYFWNLWLLLLGVIRWFFHDDTRETPQNFMDFRGPPCTFYLEGLEKFCQRKGIAICERIAKITQGFEKTEILGEKNKKMEGNFRTWFHVFHTVYHPQRRDFASPAP